jgi:uncharacterized protein YjbJ (UPF0337 family)
MSNDASVAVFAKHDAAGMAVKQTVGALVGDARLQIDSASEQVADKLQIAIGSAKDALKP